MEKYIRTLPLKKRSVFTKKVYKPIKGPSVSIPVGVMWIPKTSVWRFRWVDRNQVVKTTSVNPRAFKNRDHAFQAICNIAKEIYESNPKLKPGYYKKSVKGVYSKHMDNCVQIGVTYYDAGARCHKVKFEYTQTVGLDNPAVTRIVKKFKALRTKSFKQYRLDYLSTIPNIVDKVLYKDGTRF